MLTVKQVLENTRLINSLLPTAEEAVNNLINNLKQHDRINLKSK